MSRFIIHPAARRQASAFSLKRLDKLPNECEIDISRLVLKQPPSISQRDLDAVKPAGG